MFLSNLERWYVNGWFRGHIQRPLELALLQRLYPMPRGAQLLDIGCGDGRGLLALATRVAPLGLVGIDVDPEQIARARTTLVANGAVQLHVASADALPLPAQTYEVVTSFGCLHHVPLWQKAVAEVARVLRHGGLFYALEFYAPLLETGPIGGLLKWLLPHPRGRFTHQQFVAELGQHGMVVLGQRNFLGLAGMVVARRVAEGAYD